MGRIVITAFRQVLKVNKYSLLLAVCINMGLPIVQGQAAENARVPPQAKVMSAAELFMMYRDKTWLWSDGAGRLQEDGRTFIGWTGSGSDARWAEGKWVLSNTGLMCLKASWHSAEETQPAKTCFRHRIYNGTIYQKREPSGRWYIFKHATPAEGDEFNKLVAEDTVSTRLAMQQSNTPHNADENQSPLSTQAPNGAN